MSVWPMEENEKHIFLTEKFCFTNSARKPDSGMLSLGSLTSQSSYKKEHQANHSQLLLDCCKQNCEHQARQNPPWHYARYYHWNSAFSFALPVNHRGAFCNKYIYTQPLKITVLHSCSKFHLKICKLKYLFWTSSLKIVIFSVSLFGFSHLCGFFQ